MASTPSASALSAVLRCRGKIWTRNPPTKRPATSVYSLGLAGGALRDSSAERSRSHQAPAWEAFLQGERVVVARGLTVAYRSPRVDGEMLREKDNREINKLCHTKLSHSSGDARSAAPGVQHALVRQLTRKRASVVPGDFKSSKILQTIQCEASAAAHVCKIVFAQESSELPAGVLTVSFTSPCSVGNTGHVPCFVLTGWSALRSTCCSLTALVSALMLERLAVLWRCSSRCADVTQPQKNTGNDALHTVGQIHSLTVLTSTSEDNSSCGEKNTEDRPD